MHHQPHSVTPSSLLVAKFRVTRSIAPVVHVAKLQEPNAAANTMQAPGMGGAV